MVGAAGSATVAVNDNDVAAFSVGLSPAAIAEADAGAATLTGSITNGVTFAKPTDVVVSLGGSATPGVDFTFADGAGRPLSKPWGLRFAPGESTATAVITAVDDTRDDDGESVTVAASL